MPSRWFDGLTTSVTQITVAAWDYCLHADTPIIHGYAFNYQLKKLLAFIKAQVIQTARGLATKLVEVLQHLVSVLMLLLPLAIVFQIRLMFHLTRTAIPPCGLRESAALHLYL